MIECHSSASKSPWHDYVIHELKTNCHCAQILKIVYDRCDPLHDSDKLFKKTFLLIQRLRFAYFYGKWKTAKVAAGKNVRGIQASLKKWSESLDVFVTKTRHNVIYGRA